MMGTLIIERKSRKNWRVLRVTLSETVWDIGKRWDLEEGHTVQSVVMCIEDAFYRSYIHDQERCDGINKALNLCVNRAEYQEGKREIQRAGSREWVTKRFPRKKRTRRPCPGQLELFTFGDIHPDQIGLLNA